MRYRGLISYKIHCVICCLFTIIFIIGCFAGKPDDLVIHDKAFQLSPKEFVIKLKHPISRTRNSASVYLAVQGNWTVESPWTGIKLQNGKNIKINVSLNTAEGKKYDAKIIGAAIGPKRKFLQARFKPEIPKKEKIISIDLSASGSISCTKLLWHNFDPH